MTERTAPTVHHTVDGPADAPVVLLVNGVGTELSMWDPLLPALTGRFRVVRYDHRGHGRTPAPPGPYTMVDLSDDALAVQDAVGARSAHVVGLSIGGMVAQWLAIRAPERVDRLVLIASAAKLGTPEFWAERAGLARREGMAAAAAVVVPRWFTPAFQQREPATVQRYVDMLTACEPEGYAGCCAAIGGHDSRDRLGGVRAATLVIGGTDDPATPPEVTRALADLIPGARYAAVPDTSHLLTAEDPQTAARLVVEHLSAPGAGPT